MSRSERLVWYGEIMMVPIVISGLTGYLILGLLGVIFCLCPLLHRVWRTEIFSTFSFKESCVKRDCTENFLTIFGVDTLQQGPTAILSLSLSLFKFQN